MSSGERLLKISILELLTLCILTTASIKDLPLVIMRDASGREIGGM
jgi:hypothetical protein